MKCKCCECEDTPENPVQEHPVPCTYFSPTGVKYAFYCAEWFHELVLLSKKEVDLADEELYLERMR